MKESEQHHRPRRHQRRASHGNDDAALMRLFQGVIGHPHFDYQIVRGH